MKEVPSRFETLWGAEEAASYLGIAIATLYGWRCKKYGPPCYRVGNLLRYRPDEVREWLEAQGMAS